MVDNALRGLGAILNIVAPGRACASTQSELLKKVSRVKEEEIHGGICAQTLDFCFTFFEFPRECKTRKKSKG